ncbi:kinase-like domain-containing protein [Clohesyomyces aquaticus]|uniref:non-specific serine/threonine protein kinase n=1 Tax=Clohesyomyces aquaticus TaxID=1231657 RepID=A0A1Y2A763_9PLEO|nr:kinase-like domain-containing protein [Clohesyomyces aquaticus]
MAVNEGSWRHVAVNGRQPPSPLPTVYGRPSGRRYLVERILQERPGPLGRVYLASGDSQQYVLKSVMQNDFTYFQYLYKDLQSSPYVRVADGAIPDKSMFAYKYFKDHLLAFAQEDVPVPLVKRLLRDSLRGIASLHGKNIVHTDIKPNNIMLDWDVADLDDAANVPDDAAIIGRQVGNWMWRSPEAHASGPELGEGEEKLVIVLERQLSYFSGLESLVGLLDYLGDSPWVQIFTVIAEGFDKKHPRAPFALCKDVDPEFRDLVVKMTNIDPKRWITVHEALGHHWFADID